MKIFYALALAFVLPVASAQNPVDWSFLPSAAKPQPVLDWKFLSLSGAHAGLIIADTELTQHCIRKGTCVEDNPLLPSGRAGEYAVAAATDGANLLLAYWLKKHRKPGWWLPPAFGIGMRVWGISTGLKY